MELINQLVSRIEYIHNFQNKGITFLDLRKIFGDGKFLSRVISFALKTVHIEKGHKILTMESRGFLLATLMAEQTGATVVLVRKPGKTHNPISVSYMKEYGPDKLEYNAADIKKGDHCWIIDDIIATGGTIDAVAQAIIQESCGVYRGAFTLYDLGFDHRLSHIYSCVVLQRDADIYKYDRPGAAFLSNELFQLATIEDSIDFNNGLNPDAIVLFHPSVEFLVPKLTPHHRPHRITWKRFPNSDPHFIMPTNLKGKSVVFVMSGKYDDLMDQIQVLQFLNMQNLKTLDIIFPYFTYSTMERADNDNGIITAYTIAQTITSNLHPTKTGRPTFVTYDIHATPVLHYFSDKVTMINYSLMELFAAKHITRNDTVVFPDDGAMKRFSHIFKNIPLISCAKIRNGNERRIHISNSERIADIDEHLKQTKRVFIVDDLVRTGGTLLNTMQILVSKGVDPRNIHFYTTHADFTDGSYMRFVDHLFGKFHVYNTNPNLVSKLRKYPCFVIHEIPEYNSVKYSSIVSNGYLLVASTNQNKVNAAICLSYAIHKQNKITLQIPVASGVPEQPIGREQGLTGAKNRLRNVLNASIVLTTEEKNIIIVAIESYLELIDDIVYDIPCVIVWNAGKENVYFGERVPMPKKYYDMSAAVAFTRTAGSFLEEEYNLPSDGWFTFQNPDKTRTQQIINAVFVQQQKD